MEFKSRIDLLLHVSHLVDDGYLVEDWKIEQIEKDGKPMTHGIKVFKINYDKFSDKQ